MESVQGLLIEVADRLGRLSVGAEVEIEAPGQNLAAEVVGFRSARALCLPFGALQGVRMGARVRFKSGERMIYPTPAWLGRVVNALGQPIDGKGPLPRGPVGYALHGAPPPAHERARLGARLDLGVRTLNAFATCLEGQRMGIFAGSGVGKSVLMSMLARYTASDVSIIGLIGERGREVQEFIEDDLGAEGLSRSVVVVATSNESALMRRQAAYLTLTLSEYFRDRSNQVLCLMDSVTRFAMAQREIGLSAGEPPTTKGYTPSVFAELPKLLERAGPGARRADGQPAGAITGLFTVLVDGEDHDEPIADAVRGILDGHIVMERKIAERGRYPAINVLKSVSRTMPACNAPEETEIITAARRMLSAYDDMAELIRIGAYTAGSDPDVDAAIARHPALEAFLSQGKNERSDIPSGFAQLAEILAGDADGSGVSGDFGKPPETPDPMSVAPG